jgi:phosphodiesterase/alkaline phosphatase D-like protein
VLAAAIAVVTNACTNPTLRPAATEADAASYSIAPALSAPFAYGVASGDMTSDSAVLWTRTPGPASVTPELSLTPSFDHPRTLPAVSASGASDFTVKVLATELQAGTKYFFRFRAGSDISPVGSFRSAYAPDQHAAVRMVFTGDADWKWKPYPILASLAQENADFFLFLGDLLYESTDYADESVVEDLGGYRFKYRENREPRANSASGMLPMRDLYAAFGQYSVFDNHETGMSMTDRDAPRYTEGGAQFKGEFVNRTEGFKARIRAYREYQPVREEVHAGTGDRRTDETGRFYRAIAWGANVEMIVLDDRSYRDERLPTIEDPSATSCKRTMLGPVQLKWFEEALEAAKRRNAVWKVVVISSPIQEFGVASEVGVDMDGFKSWAGTYRCERNRILKFIDDHAIDNVVFLTTDNHYTSINNLAYETVPDDRQSVRRPARNAFEIMTGPLGAVTGTPPYGRKLDIKGLSRREADRRILSVWNGEVADDQGQLMGLKQAGLDPIGLEASFPGLEVGSIRSAGGKPGVVDPLAFASFNSYSYAVLTFDQSHVHVVVKSMPAVADPSTLVKDDAEREYENRRAEETFSFTVRAQ